MKFVDLFAGIGGFHLAASAAGGKSITCAAWCEIDEACQKLYRVAHGSSGLFVDDIQRIANPGAQPVNLPGFDLLLGGFPCQPFSNVGKRQGLSDSRGGMFFDITRILREYRPQAFVLENVQKITTMRRGEVLEQLRLALEECGYNVTVWDLMASSYGVPQQRRRLFFVGIKRGRVQTSTEIPLPPRIALEGCQYPTVWHLLERTMDRSHLIPAGTRATVLRKNPKWMGDLQIDRAIARPLTATMSKWHRANQDNYYSQAYVFGGGGSPHTPPDVNLDNEPIRRITPLEGFRLQGFPDSFADHARDAGIALSSQYRLIGNAVPVSMAAAVIKQVLNVL
jgi:DNA (cytosine-5)-methyltransferase 1